jgi:hypothetical protein
MYSWGWWIFRQPVSGVKKMTGTVNSIGGGVVVAPPVTQVAAPPPTPQNSDTAAKATALPSLSARLIDDPLAGVIVTQQLDGDGQIVSQNPPGSVIAYLQNGLTIDGYPRQSTVA